MRNVRTDSFRADYKKLPQAHKDLFKEAVRDFSAACDRHLIAATPFPASLRVKDVQGAPGVLKMTWSFAGPDGRATWAWTQVAVHYDDGTTTHEPAVLWRRIGSHRIFANP